MGNIKGSIPTFLVNLFPYDLSLYNFNAQDGGKRSKKLQVLYVKSISNEVCKSKSNDYIDGSHLCTLSPKNQGMCVVS